MVSGPSSKRRAPCARRVRQQCCRAVARGARHGPGGRAPRGGRHRGHPEARRARVRAGLAAIGAPLLSQRPDRAGPRAGPPSRDDGRHRAREAARGCDRERRVPCSGLRRPARAGAAAVGAPAPAEAMVPVSVRADDQSRDLGNRISFAFIELPVEIASRPGRLARVHTGDGGFRGLGPARRHGRGARRARPAARPAQEPGSPHGIQRARLQPHGLEHPRAAPPGLHAGSGVGRGLPGRPLAEQHALSIGMFGYRESMFFGLYADPARCRVVAPGLPGGEIRTSPACAAARGTSRNAARGPARPARARRAA